MKVKLGDYVLLYLDKRRKYLVKVVSGKELHTHKGILKLDEILGKEYGDYVQTHLGVRFRILKPLLLDHIMKFRRGTQIIYPKDAALMVIMAGIGPGSRVIEAGTGTGALTALLAYFVRPDGIVYSYDISKKNLENAKKNLRTVGLDKWVVLKLGDVTKNIDERDVDAIFLDLPSPWLAVENSYKTLRHGGVFVSFSPTINQVEKTVEALKSQNFVDYEAVEVILRRYKVEKGGTRPETFMVGHTGYIVFARKP